MDLLKADLELLDHSMRSFFQSMKRPQRWSKLTAQAGVSIDRPAAAIVFLLMDAPRPLRLQDIALAISVEAPSASRKTQELERNGYIERVPDLKDRRATTFCLTDAGRQIGSRLRAAQLQFVTQAFAGWTDAERKQFTQLFERFSNDLQTAYTAK